MSAPIPASVVRVAFRTLGCRLNQVDTEAMREALGHDACVAVVPWDDTADVYVLNSCTVTSHTEQECRRLARQVKRRHPSSRVVIAGCYAQTQPAAAAAAADAVIGNTDKDRVAQWLPQVLAAAPGEPLVLVRDFAAHPSLASPPTRAFAGHARAFVKVQDGCDLRCAYCLIWRARGPARSLPAAAVVDQLATLQGEGDYREGVLTGVHLGAWGHDLGAGRLPDLLAAVTGALPALRVRLGSLHPDELTPALLDLMVARPRLRPHLHISLQSGSDAVLARMHRPYRRDAAAAAIAAAAAALPRCGLGADLIVGFPGETEADFAATCDLVESLPFTYLHVFRFSPRPGTPAAALPDPVAAEVVTGRADQLRALAARKQQAFLRGLLGHPREAIAENGEDGEAPGYRTAITDNYATVLVPAAAVPGRLITVTPAAIRQGRLWADDIRELPEATA
jgi:threonylcarbamoyladenosine tRNA methylthiotransferase MtaB